MLPYKPAKECCKPNVGIENVVMYYGEMACKKCRYYLVEVSLMVDEKRVFAHTRGIPPEAMISQLELLENLAHPLQALTTQRDFIEINITKVSGKPIWETVLINRNYIISYNIERELLVLDERQKSFSVYIHPDNVDDLLKFIKEG